MISIDSVCVTLCQAHLYSAKELEQKCLDYIKGNLSEVLATEAYYSLLQTWPQVGLKITGHLSGVPTKKIESALEIAQKTGKRKREEF